MEPLLPNFRHVQKLRIEAQQHAATSASSLPPQLLSASHLEKVDGHQHLHYTERITDSERCNSAWDATFYRRHVFALISL